MNSLSERVAGERRRLREVRQALTAATAEPAPEGEDRTGFYLAIGDYFEAAMERLHEQDVRMGDLLRERADLEVPANRQAMAELDERLAGNEAHLRRLLAARDRLREGASGATEAFETAGRDYAAYIVENMGHHPGTTDLARELFSTADWEYMAEASDAALERERELHERVFAQLPTSVRLPEQG